MAIGFSGASLISHVSKAGLPFSDILMLGRQSHEITDDLIHHLRQVYAADLSPGDFSSTPWTEALFEKLGAQRVESMDYSDYEGASLIHDMNSPWPTGAPPRQFDLVFDGGTLEHIFNLPQALLNAMSLVRPGGSFLSVTPSDGWLGHGFHQLQPELFFRFFTPERGFKLHGVWLVEYGRAPAKTQIYRLHDPAVTGCRNQVPGRRPLEIVVHAEKTAEINPAALPWPGQSNYTAMWKDDSGQTPSPTASSRRRVRQAVMKCIPSSFTLPIKQYLNNRKYARISRAGWTSVPDLKWQ